jgi:hypothetical protein
MSNAEFYNLTAQKANAKQLVVGGSGGVSQTITASGVCDLLSSVTYVDASLPAPVTVTLPVPTAALTQNSQNVGLLKTFILTKLPSIPTAPPVTVVIAPEVPVQTQNAVLLTVNQVVTYVWNGAAWCVQSNTGAGAAGSIPSLLQVSANASNLASISPPVAGVTANAFSTNSAGSITILAGSSPTATLVYSQSLSTFVGGPIVCVSATSSTGGIGACLKSSSGTGFTFELIPAAAPGVNVTLNYIVVARI